MQWVNMNKPVLGGLEGTGLESLDSAVTDNMNDGCFAGILLGIICCAVENLE